MESRVPDQTHPKVYCIRTETELDSNVHRYSSKWVNHHLGEQEHLDHDAPEQPQKNLPHIFQWSCWFCYICFALLCVYTSTPNVPCDHSHVLILMIYKANVCW
ncbi:hypothetical protein EXN66_Car010721 [Channa argus]|uniref:Uncharacterized protein n=1 Tax=Channa argus TaxID=215402 RepID=A0A6G1PXP5_CHAAH|nr:hypothetical protein EXN66_Car010721 [Channa argus]